MSQEHHLKRRAVVTGLKPFMDEPRLLAALQHWERHYANSPRFTLQKFVAEIAREDDLRGQRSSILQSLVKAMHMSASALLPDPLKDTEVAEGAGEAPHSAPAFALLMTRLVQSIPPSAHYHFCLDFLDSLNNPRLPSELIRALEVWLGRDRPLRVPPVPSLVLRALVNRAYVLLCERLGPVAADQLLARAVADCHAAEPALDGPVNQLL